MEFTLVPELCTGFPALVGAISAWPNVYVICTLDFKYPNG
jgi:hypothetical protein